MNQSIIDFFKANLSPQEVAGKKVIELGSRNVNGSVRPDIESKCPASYIGVDLETGPSVDLVCRLEDLFATFEPASFDIVVSTEMIEHVIDFRRAINTIKGLAKPGAIVMVSTRSIGFGYHGYPYDFWRYELEDMQKLFEDMEILKLESDGSKGVILKARKLAAGPKDIENYELYNVIFQKRMCSEPLIMEKFIVAAQKTAYNSYFAENGTLATIAKRAGTDKLMHGYLDKYESFLKKFRDEKFNLLELGVAGGSSIRMWEEYFHNANIYGCDIRPTAFAATTERCKILIMDLSKADSYRRLSERTYKIILDDASHFQDQQLLAFFELFPQVESGGIYIIEDLQTSFPPIVERFMHGSSDTTANVLLHLAELILSQNKPSREINGYHNLLKAFSPEIECIAFIAKSCIMIKK